MIIIGDNSFIESRVINRRRDFRFIKGFGVQEEEGR